MKAAVFVFPFLAIISSPVHANVGYFRGSGHSIRMSHSADIQLVSEKVLIAPILANTCGADRVSFRCQFVLKNHSTDALSVQVGFPLNGELPLRPGATDTEQVLEHSFIARDEHETYHVRYVRQDEDAKYHGIFVWDMKFAAQEQKTLHVGYVLPMSITIGSSARRGDNQSGEAVRTYNRPWYAVVEHCIVEHMTYVTETGSSWRGPIEEATFQVFADELTMSQGDREAVFLAAIDPPAGTSQPQQLFTMKVGLTYLQSSPAGWTRDPENGWMTWKVKNYRPGTPVQFYWFGTCLPQRADQAEAVVRSLMGAHPKEAEVLELAEIVGAFYGLEPRTAAVKDFVSRQVWYHPKNGLRRCELTTEQQETLTRLEEIAGTGLQQRRTDGEQHAR